MTSFVFAFVFIFVLVLVLDFVYIFIGISYRYRYGFRLQYSVVELLGIVLFMDLIFESRKLEQKG